MTYAIRDEQIKQSCLRQINGLLACDPPQHEVVIRKHDKRKTAQQRKYLHKILHVVCNYTGDDVEDAKMKIKYAVLPLREITLSGNTYLYPISSERASVKQYGDLIEAALMFAAEAGVSVPTPNYYGWDI